MLIKFCINHHGPIVSVIKFVRTMGVSQNENGISYVSSSLQGASRLAFCIGGPYGHGQQLRQRANVSIKLSSMVLNHQIALLVLMEQLYRYFFVSSLLTISAFRVSFATSNAPQAEFSQNDVLGGVSTYINVILYNKVTTTT